MKKLLAILAITGIMTFGFSTFTVAQDAADADTTTVDAQADTSTVSEPAPEPAASTITVDESAVVEEEAPESFQQIIKTKFIEGGVEWMGPVLVCLIIGLAIAIERIITLNMATTNTKKLLAKVEDALATGGVEGAKEVTKNTRGPVASIFTQGLMRMSEGIEMVEKSIISYGSVEMGRLERGLVWVSLFIALAPMLGFTGTVIGMISAFDAIEAAGDISPQIVANGIKTALLTTVAGLFVGIILQVFYNYLVSKIDGLVNQMEDASITLVDMLVKHNLSK
ncbi:MAG: MotA/TolQ/ExbB proton channel family protein [Cyclobacteriaceae bacterium]|nr:MotA/TolQ/ExbB proton channel family protein [Cyclobacteriaceae bacterium]